MNVSDSERLERPLVDAGWKKANDIKSADLVILNTCSVRQKAEDKVTGLGQQIIKLKEKNSKLKVIVTGCMVKKYERGSKNQNKKLRRLEKDIRERLHWADYVADIFTASKLVQKLANEEVKEFFKVVPVPSSKITALIPISFGCDNFCSYCVVPYARGTLENRPFSAIIKEAREAIENNSKEIYLLGQNVNSWVGEYKNKKMDFPTLLKEIDSLPGEYWIRFISSHPKDISEELIDVISEGTHITPCLHFALQSGSNQILKAMNRHYSYASFKKMVDYARKKIPNIAITTDIIVGFPGETEEDFQKTVKALKECKFDMAYIGIYSPRPGTKSAEEMKDNVPINVKKERHRILTKILGEINYKKNKALVGKTVKVLVEKPKSGLTDINQEIRLNKKAKVGSFTKCTVTKATSWALEGNQRKSH